MRFRVRVKPQPCELGTRGWCRADACTCTACGRRGGDRPRWARRAAWGSGWGEPEGVGSHTCEMGTPSSAERPFCVSASRGAAPLMIQLRAERSYLGSGSVMDGSGQGSTLDPVAEAREVALLDQRVRREEVRFRVNVKSSRIVLLDQRVLREKEDDGRHEEAHLPSAEEVGLIRNACNQEEDGQHKEAHPSSHSR